MDRRSIGALINSISRLLHLVSCQTSKTAAINEFKCIVGMLKPLKCIIDEAFGSPFPWDERLVTAIEELDMAVNEARDFLEKGPHRFGKIYSVRARSLLFLFFFNLFKLDWLFYFIKNWSLLPIFFYLQFMRSSQMASSIRNLSMRICQLYSDLLPAYSFPSLLSATQVLGVT